MSAVYTGIPALVTLGVVAVAGRSLGERLVASQRITSTAGPASASPRVERLQVLFSTMGLVAFVFWAWAMLHVMGGTPDLGAVSFMISMLSSGVGISSCLQARGLPSHAGSCAVSLRRMAAYTGGSGALVALNYLGGLGVASAMHAPFTLHFYFLVAAGWWAIWTVAAVRLINQQHAHVIATPDPDTDEARQALRWS